ncbi:helix-turn-helix transcriptional regulator [Kribbella deserti]|uniref:Helix-turn-helix transcriptional regulator n=1 Tax=Kribbella deserti TaxID=1926257 RepID=A0ABV6QMX6_9ACTN
MNGAMGRRVSSSRLIGRGDELAALKEFLAGLRQGEPGVAMVSGRAGSGKTRLIAELDKLLRKQRVTVLRGTCLPLDAGGPPYLPLHTALRPALPHEAPVLAALADPGLLSRTQLFEQLRVAMEALGGHGRCVLVVEDVHWADRATQDALLYLVAQMTAGRWGLVLTMRPEDYSGGNTLSDALERRPVLRVQLGTMTQDEVREQAAAITGTMPTEDDAAILHRRTGGIPLLVEEVLAAGGSGVPDHLRAIFLSRIKALGADVGEVLNAAAVVGRVCDERVFAEVLDRSLNGIREASRLAVEGDLLAVEDGGYRIRHELLKDAVYEALPPARRRELHLRTARVLTGLGQADAAELAHHWHRGGAAEEAARTSLVAAALAERAAAPGAAYLHFERVLALWSAAGEEFQSAAGGRAEVLRLTAIAAERSGAFDAAVALTEERLGHCRDVDLPLVWERLARYRWQDGDGLGAATAYQESIQRLPPDARSDARAKVLSGYAWYLSLSGSADDAMSVSAAALETARDVTDPAIRWQVLFSWGLARLDTSAGLEALEQARELAASLDAGYDVAICDLQRNVSLRSLGRYSDCEAVLRNGLRYAAAHGLSRSVGAVLSYMLAERLIECGDWAEASELLRSARAQRTRGIPAYFTGGYLARLAAYQGDDSLLTDSVAEVESIAVTVPQQPVPHAMALLAKAERSLWAGQPSSAAQSSAAAMEVLVGETGYRANAAAVLARAQADMAHSAVLRGDVAYRPILSQSELCRLAAEWRTSTHEPVRAFSALVRAEADRMDGARDPIPWRNAVEAWSIAGWPYWTAYARWRLGWALLRERSGRPEARQELRGAYETACALGAEPLRGAIEELAVSARLQVVPGADRAEVWAADEFGLTARESEVLPLLAAGRTNAEIAQILVISPRTVGEHVSRILHKLGAGRRTEAAAIARRAGLIDTSAGEDGIRRSTDV